MQINTDPLAHRISTQDAVQAMQLNIVRNTIRQFKDRHFSK